MRGFRVSLVVGTVLVVSLAAAGLYAIALAAAAALVPVVTILYLWDVDLYEDEPLRVLAFTVAWGAFGGAAVALAAERVTPDPFGDSSSVAMKGVLLPLLGVALSVAGPLVLLPYRKFNDVLDGTTFGSSTAVVLFGVVTLSAANNLLGAGLRPTGAVVPWSELLITLAVAEPVLAAAAIGSATGTFWFRYRTRGDDHLGSPVPHNPFVATVLASALLILGACSRLLLSPALSLLTIGFLAIVALAWLRNTVHIGLTQESNELEIGPSVTCANCGALTPNHTFCIDCGIALRALPKGRRPGVIDTPPNTSG